MRTKKYLICLLSIIAFATLSSGSFASKYHYGNHLSYSSALSDMSLDEESQATMNLSSTSEQIIIQFDNPAQELLTFEIYNPSGTVFTTITTTDVSGQIMLSIADLDALGGGDVYQVDMFSGDGKKKVEGGTIVIIRE